MHTSPGGHLTLPLKVTRDCGDDQLNFLSLVAILRQNRSATAGDIRLDLIGLIGVGCLPPCPSFRQKSCFQR